MPIEETISIHERLGVLETKMDTVIEQTTETNGSVAKLKVWQGIMQGAIGVLTAIVIPVLFMFLSNWLNNK